MTTAPATLEDVFTSVQFSASHAITQSDFKSAAVAPGVRLVRYRAVRPRLAPAHLPPQRRRRSARAPASRPTSVRSRLSGTITLKITVHVAGAVSWGKVTSFETSETTTVSSDLKASVTKELSFKQEKTLASWGAGQLLGFTVWAGPVPLYFQPELSIFVGVDGQFAAGVETAIHYEASGGLGMRYQAPTFSAWASLGDEEELPEADALRQRLGQGLRRRPAGAQALRRRRPLHPPRRLREARRRHAPDPLVDAEGGHRGEHGRADRHQLAASSTGTRTGRAAT